MGEHVARFLIVDDDDDNLFLLENLLPKDLCESIKARSGREALDKLFEYPLTAMFIDIMMPGLDGLSTANIIRNRSEFDDMRIIFVTAVDPKNPLIEEARQIKNTQVLFKPLSKSALLQCIHGLLNSSKTSS